MITQSIVPQDFSHKRVDSRTGWEAGMIRHLLAALGDTPVVITPDGNLGLTFVGVKLLGISAIWGTTNAVLVDHGTHQTAYPIFQLGASITPLVDVKDDRVKDRALETYRLESSAATQRAQGSTLTSPRSGRYVSHVTLDGVDVRFEIGANAHQRRGESPEWLTSRHWSYSTADLEATCV